MFVTRWHTKLMMRQRATLQCCSCLRVANPEYTDINKDYMLLQKNTQSIQANRKYSISLSCPDQGELLQINVELPQVFTVEDAVKFSLELLNGQYGLKLRWKEGLYNLYVAKRNGQPKQDLPSLDPEQVIFETGSQLFVIVTKLSLIDLQSLPPDTPQIKQSNSVGVRSVRELQLEDSSIKPRTSYQNGLMDDRMKSKKQEQKDKNDGLCFSCF